MGFASAQILCVDQSTSGTKAMLFDAAGGLLARTAVEHRQIYPKPGWVEHDAAEIWDNVREAIRAVLASSPPGAADVPACLSITNQRETFVVFDRRTGEPLHNAVVWQCRRGAGACEELSARGHEETVRRKTGLRIDTYFSGPKLAWLMRHEPQIAARVRAGEALVGTIDAYLIHRLTNGKVFATDHTNASRTLLYNIHTLAWDDGLCELFGVPAAALPEVRESGGHFGETDVGGLLPRAVPICGVMGDSQAALFAHGCFEPGAAKVTFGTGSSVLLNVGAEPREAAGGIVTSLAWVLGGRPTYCFEGIINYSAATLAWLRERLGLIRDMSEVEPLAAAAADNGGVYLVPAFAGMGAPHWDASARGAILGLTAYSGREHVLRAAVESIAYQVRDVLEAMRAASRVDLRAIHADGGATTNALLMQFTADMTGLDVRVAEVPECSALGAAMAGALGRGLYRSQAELTTLPRPSRTYRPQLAAARVAEHYQGWQRAVRSVLTAGTIGEESEASQ